MKAIRAILVALAATGANAISVQTKALCAVVQSSFWLAFAK